MTSHHAWYRNWFDSPYYHMLYHYRDESEADQFLSNLLKYLDLPQQSRILDAACGRGRHSRYLHAHGYLVTGIDLSSNSIQYAKQNSDPKIDFRVADMRDFTLEHPVDAVMNLFTSFGYFENDEPNVLILRNFADALEEKGRVVLDFLNAHPLKQELPLPRRERIEDVLFVLQKELHANTLINHINISDRGETYEFEERVQLIELEDFERYFHAAGLVIDDVFGDYALTPYDPQTSPRLILIGSKK